MPKILDQITKEIERITQERERLLKKASRISLTPEFANLNILGVMMLRKIKNTHPNDLKPFLEPHRARLKVRAMLLLQEALAAAGKAVQGSRYFKLAPYSKKWIVPVRGFFGTTAEEQLENRIDKFIDDLCVTPAQYTAIRERFVKDMNVFYSEYAYITMSR
jgi:hypothetical protein